MRSGYLCTVSRKDGIAALFFWNLSHVQIAFIFLPKAVDFFWEIAYNDYAMKTLHWKRANLLAERNPWGSLPYFLPFFRKRLTFSQISHRIVVPIRQVRLRNAPPRSLLNRRSGFFFSCISPTQMMIPLFSENS